MELDRDTLRKISADIDVALMAIQKKHGLEKLAVNGGNFDRNGTFTLKVDGTMCGALSKEAKAYNIERGYDKELPALGTVFTTRGVRYSITGMKPRGSNIICEDLGSGKKYLFHTASVKAACGTITFPIPLKAPRQ